MSTLGLTPETPVGEVASTYPVTLRMLDALGIDYCCGGGRSLAEASAERGLPVATTLSVLQAAIAQAAESGAAETNWMEAPIEALLSHIVDTHHTYMHAELPRIAGMLATVVRVHGPHHGDVLSPLAGLFAELQTELTQHLEKEETVSFPAIRRLLAGDVDEVVVRTVRELEDEHEQAGAVLAQMRLATDGYALPADVCATYRALYDALQVLEQDIHRHIHLENNILFPRVRALLPPSG